MHAAAAGITAWGYAHLGLLPGDGVDEAGVAVGHLQRQLHLLQKLLQVQVLRLLSLPGPPCRGVPAAAARHPSAGMAPSSVSAEPEGLPHHTAKDLCSFLAKPRKQLPVRKACAKARFSADS